MACLRACRGLRGFSLEGSQGAKKKRFWKHGGAHIYNIYLYIYMYKCGLHGGVVFQVFSTAEVISESCPAALRSVDLHYRGACGRTSGVTSSQAPCEGESACQSATSSQRRTACVHIVFFRPLVPAGLSEEFVPSLKKENQHKKKQNKNTNFVPWLQKSFCPDPQPGRPPTTMKTLFFFNSTWECAAVCVSSSTSCQRIFPCSRPTAPEQKAPLYSLIASLPKVFLDQTAEMAQVLFKA